MEHHEYHDYYIAAQFIVLKGCTEPHPLNLLSNLLATPKVLIHVIIYSNHGATVQDMNSCRYRLRASVQWTPNIRTRENFALRPLCGCGMFTDDRRAGLSIS